jgi:hypothetical protein
MIKQLVERMDELQAELANRAEAQLQQTTVESLLAQSGTPSTRPQESSESTQMNGPSVDSSPLATLV